MSQRSSLPFVAIVLVLLTSVACGDDSSGDDGGSSDGDGSVEESGGAGGTGGDAGGTGGDSGGDSGATGGTSSGGSGGAGGTGGSSGSGGTGGGSGTSGEPAEVEPVGLSDKSFLFMGTDQEALELAAGVYDVAIYKTPEGKESDLGPATLELALDGDDQTLTLKDDEGTVLAEVTGVGQWTRVIGMLLVDQADAPITRMSVRFAYENRFAPEANYDGFLSGYAGEPQSNGSYMFRNYITHYGPTPPALLDDVIGTWSGPQLALTCDRPEVTVVVEEGGKVTNSGTANLACTEGEIMNTWDGQDDYVVPMYFAGGATQAGFQVNLDTQKGGGSQPEGGIRVLVSEAEPRVILSVASVLSGSNGNIEAELPAMQ